MAAQSILEDGIFFHDVKVELKKRHINIFSALDQHFNHPIGFVIGLIDVVETIV